MNRFQKIKADWAYRRQRKVLILMYHRVADYVSDPWALCVSPRNFEDQLSVLRRIAPPMSLTRLIADLRGGKVPRRSVVITFDDGYADNLHIASPLLQKYDAPATIFLVSSHINRSSEYWWDELDRIFLSPGQLPSSLHMKIEQTAQEWKFNGVSQYSEAEAQKHREWRAWDTPPTQRHSAYFSLWQQLRPLKRDDRHQKLEELRSWANVSDEGRDTHRVLSANELETVKRQILFEIGCHTATHPQLSSLPEEAQRNEIQSSKAAIEEMIGQRVHHFAYPFGGKDDYSAATVSIVQESGFTSSCSTIPEVIKSESDVYQLPRVQIEDWNGAEFEKRISQWFGDTTS